jgi:hypothetical protein
VKYAKANTLNTQRFIARYGKAARHPVCQAWLSLRGLAADIEEGMKKAVQIDEDVNSAKHLKEEAEALVGQFRKEQKEKEANLWAAHLRKINEHLPKLQTGYGAQVAYCLMLCRELRPVAVALFERENDAVVRAGNAQAFRALKLVKQRWRTNPMGKGARLRAGDQRELEILKMHRDKVTKAALTTKDEVGAGYLEALRGGHRLLSDEVWQGRLTVREIYSRLMTVGGSRLAGDKDGKAIRRILTRLGIRPAVAQPGRKWKPPYPKKQEAKKPSGRPRIKPDLKYTDNIAAFGFFPVVNLDKLTANGLVESGDPEVSESDQVVEGSEFTESDQVVESSRFNEAHQFFVPDWLKRATLIGHNTRRLNDSAKMVFGINTKLA